MPSLGTILTLAIWMLVEIVFCYYRSHAVKSCQSARPRSASDLCVSNFIPRFPCLLPSFQLYSLDTPADASAEMSCGVNPARLKDRMEEKRFVELQGRRSQTEGRIGIFKNGFLGRPLRIKEFEHRELAVDWQELTHNLWVQARPDLVNFQLYCSFTNTNGSLVFIPQSRSWRGCAACPRRSRAPRRCDTRRVAVECSPGSDTPARRFSARRSRRRPLS